MPISADGAGRLCAIARRSARRAPMMVIGHGRISAKAGLEGDSKGARFVSRQVTILTVESWQAALDDLATPIALDWTVRRANLLVAGVALPRAKGGLIRIREVVLEVTGQTFPCARMDEAHAGLLKALGRDWRGGVTCRVRSDGEIAVGDQVEILHAPPEACLRLPG